jgi:WD40 repeat protein
MELWLERDPGVLMIHGLGGSGKTELCRFLLQDKGLTDAVIWCSLRDAPSLSTLAANLLTRYPPDKNTPMPQSPFDRLTAIVAATGGILVFDNFEAVLDSIHGKEYTELIERIVVAGQIRLLVTTRVLPSLEPRYSRQFAVLHLLGLKRSEARELVATLGLSASDAEADELIARLDGNPLAIKLAAELAHELYGGRLSTYLRSPSLTLDGVGELLREHLHNASPDENLVMYRLATAREPLTFDAIVAETLLEDRRADAVSAIRRLVSRSLVERRRDLFFLQYLVQESVLQQLIQTTTELLLEEGVASVAPLPFVNTERPIHIRQAQRRLTIAPMARALNRAGGGIAPSASRLLALIDSVRLGSSYYGSFAAANLMELILALGTDPTGLDFSKTRLRHLDLSDTSLRNVDFHDCEFDRCRFSSAHEHVFGVGLANGGSFAVLGQGDGSIAVVEVPSGNIQRSFPWDAVWLRAVAISPDDRLAAVTDDRGRIRIVNLLSGHTLDLPGNGRQIRSLAFSTDGSLLFSGGEDGAVRRINPATGAELEALVTAGSEVWALAQDADILAIATEADGLRIVNLTDNVSTTGAGTVAGGRSVIFSRSGSHLFVGGNDGSVSTWNRGGQLVNVMRVHEGAVWALATAVLDGNPMIFSGSHDGTLRQFDAVQPAELRQVGMVVSDEGPVWPVIVDRGGTVLLSVNGSSVVRFWNPRNLQPLERLKGGLRRIFVVSSNDDGSLVATGGQDGVVRLWNRDMSHSTHELVGHRGGLRTLAFGPSGQSLASAGEDCDVRIWDALQGQLLVVLEGPRNWVWCMSFDPSGRYLAAGSADLRIHVWDLHGGSFSTQLSGHTARIVGVSFLADEAAVISCSVDGEVRLWDTRSRTGSTVARLPDGATKLVHLGHGRVAVGDRTGHIHIFVHDGGDVRTLTAENQSSAVSALAVINDEKLVAGMEDGSVVFWDWRSSTATSRATPDARAVHSIALLGHGAEIALAIGLERLPIVNVGDPNRTRTIAVPRQYEGVDITGSIGLSRPERDALLGLGAIDLSQPDVSPAQRATSEEPPARPQRSGTSVTVFISYSHDDQLQMQGLRDHLTVMEVTGEAEIWTDRQIGPGADWDAEIDERLERADVVLLLLSSDFIASAYCRREMERAVARADHGDAVVIPILLRQCDWLPLPVARYQALPGDGQTVAGARDLDEVRSAVAKNVRKRVSAILASKVAN